MRGIIMAAALLLAGAVQTSAAEKQYGPGVTNTEIRIGQTMPYSGPVSFYSIAGRAQEAYFKMINDKGGINGRKISLISVDDAFAPPKTLEATRRLVEQDGVLLMFGSIGTATQNAVQKYLTSKRVPQLFVMSGASKWNNPREFPWTTPAFHLYSTEGEIQAKYLLEEKPGAKVGILMQNDDFGKDFVAGFKRGLATNATTMIVKEASFDVGEPTLDTQIVALRQSGADVLIDVSLGKQTAQVIKRLAELNWRPMHFVVSPSTGRPILEAAGLGNAKGIVAATPYKQASSASLKSDAEIVAYRAFMKEYLPKEDETNEIAFLAYSWAAVLTKMIDQLGDNLTQDAIVSKAANMKAVTAPALLPGITYNTSPTDYSPIKTLRLQTFNGESWDGLREVQIR